MRKFYSFFLLFLLFTACKTQKVAQMPSPYRVTPVIPKISIAIWYQLDLREPLNQAYFRYRNEFPRLLLEGIQSGAIEAYADEQLKKSLSQRGVERWFGGGLNTLNIQQLYKIALKRDVLYDPQSMTWEHSFANVLSLYNEETPRLEHSVIALYPPAQHRKKKPIYFSFYEVGRHVLAANPRSTYQNPYAPSQSMNYFDALQFRLYSAKIIRYKEAHRKRYVKVKSKQDIKKLKAAYQHLPHFCKGLIYYEKFHWKNAYVAYLNSKH